MRLIDLIKSADMACSTGAVQEAIDLYQNWISSSGEDLKYVAYFNLGTLLGGVKKYQEAELAFLKALELNPNLHQARLNLGHQLENQGKRTEAILEWKNSVGRIEQDAIPDQNLLIHALNNLARIIEIEREYEESEQYMLRSLVVNPDQSAVLSHYIHIRQKQCRWPVYEERPGVTINKQIISTSALAMLAAFDDPALQLLSAREFVHSKVSQPGRSINVNNRKTASKIRIGYLSGDLCMHAVGLLTVELFELHNRDEFDVIAFCWSKEDGSDLRARIVNAFDEIYKIDKIDDAAAAELIASKEIDILIDLQGLTSGARPNILMNRPAGVQVSYLGLPGTSALPTVDYIIADRYVYPDSLKPYMTELPLYVDRCYQVSDRKRSVGAPLSRKEVGLPADKVVFAAFNNNYKISEPVFEIWMEILKGVPDSVIWLMADNIWASNNMKTKAENMGIDSARLIFSSRATPTEYMSRLALPDLFLDTYPYNAGTTANDILWMGTPILTCSGATYISRMCGSLLKAVGLSELITTDLESYKKKAIQLGVNKKMLYFYKEFLRKYKMESDLFNIPLLVRDIESAYKTALLQKQG